MSVTYFSPEQIKQLETNPYINRISDKAITYSESFKELFMREYTNGKLPSQIFNQAGIPADVVGPERVKSFSKRIRSHYQRGAGLTDLRSTNSGRTRSKVRSTEDELTYLRQKLALKDQQIEALKKINFLNRKAAMTSKKQAKNSD